MAILARAQKHGVASHHIATGKPQQHAHVESFGGKQRGDGLKANTAKRFLGQLRRALAFAAARAKLAAEQPFSDFDPRRIRERRADQIGAGATQAERRKRRRPAAVMRTARP